MFLNAFCLRTPILKNIWKPLFLQIMSSESSDSEIFMTSVEEPTSELDEWVEFSIT